MTSKIVVIATVGPADDHRYFYKQIFTLSRFGWSVDFFCKEAPPIELPCVSSYVVGPALRRWTRLTGGLSLLPRVIKRMPAAVQICSVELLPLALILAAVGRVPVFYDCREDMPTSLMEHKDNLPYPCRFLISKMALAMEWCGARVFAGVSVSDHWLHNKFSQMGLKNCFLFPNFPRRQDFASLDTEGLDPVKRNVDFCVLGSMSERTGVVEFVSALAKLCDRGDWKGLARLIGHPGERLSKELTEIASCAGFDLEITGRVPYERVPRELAECKVGVIPLTNMKKFHRNPATKMFEYCAAGLYIVATDLPPQRRYLEDAEFADLVEPDSVDALAAGLLAALGKQRKDPNGVLPFQRFNNCWNADSLYDDLAGYYSRGVK